MRPQSRRASMIPLLLVLLLLTPGCRPHHAVNIAAAPPAGEVLDIQPLSTLTQYDNGPGVAVWPPRCAPANQQFALGAAGWMQFMLGGHGEFGKTPMWVTYKGALNAGLQVDPAAPDPATVAKITRKLGITHLVTGDLVGSPVSSRLILRLWDTARTSSVGAPVEIGGSPDELTHALPGAAREFCKRLGVAAPRIPNTLLSAHDVSAAGGTMVPVSRTGSARFPFAAAPAPYLQALSLLDTAGQNSSDQVRRAEELLAQTPDHILLWGLVNEALLNTRNIDPLPLRRRLNPLLKRFPHSYVLHEADAFVWSLSGVTSELVAAQEEAVRCSTQNPTAWHNLGDAISYQANSIRQARFANALSQTELEVLQPLYERGEVVARKATELDPDSWQEWLALSGAAAFNSDMITADRAYQRAASLGHTSNIYTWGAQLYSPKWAPNNTKLRQVAAAAASDPQLSQPDRVLIAETLHGNGRDDLARIVVPEGSDSGLRARWALEQQRAAQQRRLAAAARPKSPADRTEAFFTPPDGSGETPATGAVPAQQPSGEITTSATSRAPSRHRGIVFALAWSPAGTDLASAGPDGVKLWHSNTGSTEALLGVKSSRYAVAWSPDGRRLACSGADGTISVWSIDPLKELRQLKGHAGPVRALAWSADAVHLASGGDDASVRIWNAATGAPERTLRGHHGSIGNVSYNRDGSYLLSVASQPGKGKLRVWDTRTGACLREPDSSANLLASVSWSPDGQRLAVAAPRSVNIVDPTSGQSQVLSTDTFYYTIAVAWGQDGKSIVASRGDRKLHLLDAATGKERSTLITGDTQAVCLAWGPHKDVMAVGSADGQIALHSPDEFVPVPAANARR